MNSRLLIRVLLVLAFIAAVSSIVLAFTFLGFRDGTAWAVVAGALAVITSVISSWSAQRALELQQDAQAPYPYPYADVSSRLELAQIRIRNFGGTAAHHIKLAWDKPIQNTAGKQIRFSSFDDRDDIPVLLPNDSVAVLVDGANSLFQAYQDLEFTGQITFTDPSGHKYSHRFQVSFEQYRLGLVFDTEAPKTNHELQKIPGAIDELTSELKEIKSILKMLTTRGIGTNR